VVANVTCELPSTRIDAIAEEDCAAPLATIKRGNAIPDRIPMIPQTNSKSITAKPLDCRIFTANTLRGPMLQDLYRMCCP
jgi:hypothetical protein